MRVFKYPVALECKVNYPTDYIGSQFCPPQAPVQALIGRKENKIAGPEISAAANHKFGKLDNKFFIALSNLQEKTFCIMLKL